nr:neutrophil defensin 4-like [Aotus nancymaae]
MRTLTLLAVVLLVALQAQAEPLQARADEAAAQEQPGADDQEVGDYFAWDESTVRQDSGSMRGLGCTCRRDSCPPGERRRGTCSAPGVRYPYCCR